MGKLFGSFLFLTGVASSVWGRVMAARSAAASTGRSPAELLLYGYWRGQVLGVPAVLWFVCTTIVTLVGAFVFFLSM